MKIAIFTSNQSRHHNLIRTMASIADDVFVVSEVTTIFPGMTADFYNSSDVMKDYFRRMQAAEQKIFGVPDYLPKNVSVLPIKMGDINSIPIQWFKKIEDVDYIIVFGASWIKGDLCELLIQKKAVNIHMGVSPYYRGATCNFWALQDGRPELVGATIHYLSKGLDSGKMIMHTLPKAQRTDGFSLGMLAVKAAHEGLRHLLSEGNIFQLESEIQNKSLELRYSRRSEFNDDVAQSFLRNPLSEEVIFQKCSQRRSEDFLRPYFY
jgi:hypothetical protein